MTGTATLTVDALTAADWPAVSAIYAEGIAAGNATFETEIPSWSQWSDRDAHHPDLAFVARDAGEVVGWAAAAAVSKRPAYRGVAEVSVYVAGARRRRGAGRLLLRTLVDRSEAAGIWTLQAGVFPENLASIRLHLSCGFRVVGVRERLGRLRGVWRDVVLLERRSKEIR